MTFPIMHLNCISPLHRSESYNSSFRIAQKGYVAKTASQLLHIRDENLPFHRITKLLCWVEIW